jgi:hypothetical protein
MASYTLINEILSALNNKLTSSSGCTTSFIECFGLLNDFFPFMPVLDAVLPIIYFHGIQIIFNIILPPSLGVFLMILLPWVSIHIPCLPFFCLAFYAHAQANLTFVIYVVYYCFVPYQFVQLVICFYCLYFKHQQFLFYSFF